MKKLLVVLSALFLIAAFTVPVMASDIELSGEFRMGFITMFDPAKDAASWGRLEFDLSAAVDDYNTVEFEIDAEDGFDLPKFKYFKLITDVGSAFDLPIGLETTNGYFVPETEGYDAVTGLEYEANAGGDIEPEMAHKLSFGFGPANFNLAFGIAEQEIGSAFDFLAELDVPEVGPASFDIYYEVDDNEDLKGAVGFEATATVGPAEIGAAFEYDSNATEDDPTTPFEDETTAEWFYGVGASAGVSMLTVGVGLNGDELNELDQFGLDLNVEPAEDYGLDLGLGLSFADGADTFQGVEVSGYYNIGAAELRAGYLYTENEFSYYAPNSYDTVIPEIDATTGLPTGDVDPAGGGFFIRFDIDY